MFRPPKPRQFQYHYRFSDPQKAELEKRVRFMRSESRREQEMLDQGEVPDTFGPFSGMMHRRRYGARSNRMMVYILAGLLAVVLFILLR